MRKEITVLIVGALVVRTEQWRQVDNRGAERSVSSPNSNGSQAQESRGTAPAASCSRREDFAAGDLVVRCQTQPRSEVLCTWPC